VKQELIKLVGYRSSLPVVIGIVKFLVLCSCFVYHCLSFYLFFRTLFCLSFFALPYMITQITWRMRTVRQELLTIPGHQSSLSVVCRVRIAHYFAFCVVFLLDHCISVYPYYRGYCISSNYPPFGIYSLSFRRNACTAT
jgi:hypothetical protein